ncbi:MAG: hypothetical protein WKF43_02135 [Acidimicrobiales bacterium]
MTAPRPSGDRQATLRGVLVLAAAVVIGLALLSRASSSGLIGSAEAGGSKPTPSTSTSTTVPQEPVVDPNTQGTDPVPPTTHVAAEVKVIVINATGGQAGVGTENDAKVKAGGFASLPVSNAAAAPVTTVYFADGYEGDANAVKLAVNLGGAGGAGRPTRGRHCRGGPRHRGAGSGLPRLTISTGSPLLSGVEPIGEATRQATCLSRRSRTALGERT